jgi:hypothetical protein
MAIHLRPPVARRLMRPTRGLGSAPLPPRRSPAAGLRPPIWPCSGWSLPRFTPFADPRAGERHRHCGTGPRLTADGRYPPPCAAELGLSSRRRRVTPRDARPSDRLADPRILRPAAAGEGRDDPTRPANALNRPAGAPRSPVRRRGLGRWPRWPAGPRPSSARVGRDRPSSGRTRRASGGPPTRAG